VTGDDVRAVEFREKWRGYHPGEVDALLEKVAEELDAGRPVTRLVRGAQFRQKLRGYHPDDVDRFLKTLTEG
jgi:DivIVA domain-containing protein